MIHLTTLLFIFCNSNCCPIPSDQFITKISAIGTEDFYIDAAMAEKDKFYSKR